MALTAEQKPLQLELQRGQCWCTCHVKFDNFIPRLGIFYKTYNNIYVVVEKGSNLFVFKLYALKNNNSGKPILVIAQNTIES